MEHSDRLTKRNETSTKKEFFFEIMHNFGPVFRGKREDLFFFLRNFWGFLDDIGNGFFKVRMFVCSRICVFCVCEWMVELSGAVEMKIFRKKCIGAGKGNKGEERRKGQWLEGARRCPVFFFYRRRRSAVFVSTASALKQRQKATKYKVARGRR